MFQYISATSLLRNSGRRQNISAAELEEYKKQAECLNLPAPAVLDPQKGIKLRRLKIKYFPHAQFFPLKLF